MRRRTRKTRDLRLKLEREGFTGNIKHENRTTFIPSLYKKGCLITCIAPLCERTLSSWPKLDMIIIIMLGYGGSLNRI
jgi:hypothetical protein